MCAVVIGVPLGYGSNYGSDVEFCIIGLFEAGSRLSLRIVVHEQRRRTLCGITSTLNGRFAYIQQTFGSEVREVIYEVVGLCIHTSVLYIAVRIEIGILVAGFHTADAVQFACHCSEVGTALGSTLTSSKTIEVGDVCFGFVYENGRSDYAAHCCDHEVDIPCSGYAVEYVGAVFICCTVKSICNVDIFLKYLGKLTAGDRTVCSVDNVVHYVDDVTAFAGISRTLGCAYCCAETVSALGCRQSCIVVYLCLYELGCVVRVCGVNFPAALSAHIGLYYSLGAVGFLRRSLLSVGRSYLCQIVGSGIEHVNEPGLLGKSVFFDIVEAVEVRSVVHCAVIGIRSQ